MAGDAVQPGALGRAFRTFLSDPGLTPGAASSLLRGTFLAVFAGQALVATVVAAAVAIVAGRQDAPSGWVAGVSLVGAAGQLLLGLAITAAGVRQMRLRAADAHDGDGEDLDAVDDDVSGATDPAHHPERIDPERALRSAALSQTVLSAVLLSTPAWFGAFAWVTGQTLITLAGVAALAMLGYGAGMMMLAALARLVAARPRSGPEADG